MAETILIIEDEKDLAELVKFHLQESGYQVTIALRGDEGFKLATRSSVSLIILDLMLPGLSGIEILKKLKHDLKTRSIPVIVLTARSEEVDRVLGFEMGADDYVTKPFSPRELMLRVRTVLRRIHEPETMSEYFEFGALKADLTRPRIRFEGKDIPLTAVEIKLLQFLFINRGRVQSREILLDRVWGYNAMVTTRTVDVHVKRLRQKLGKGEYLIETVRGMGYRFIEEP